MSPPAVHEFAPAKVNLTLRVGPLQADGYHPVDSLAAFADWGDEIAVTEGEGLSLILAGPGGEALQDEPENLVLKAAYALRAAVERPELTATITLTKHLPVASGLGGGSADAAAALRALARFWDLGLPVRALAEIGSVVGSDVPACVYSRPLLMRGRGERISALIAWPELHAVIANPGVPVATKDVFAAYDAGSPERLGPASPAVAGTPEAALAQLEASRNDLEAPAIGLEPVIGETLAALGGGGAQLVRMSGSGASCFAILESREAAENAAIELSARHPGWTVRAVTLAGAVR